MNSIIQSEKECFFTKDIRNLEEHHIFCGSGRRKLSEKYGLKVWLRSDIHRTGNYSVHNQPNKDIDLKLKQIGQEAFEKTYPNLDFVKIFGRNYLE